MKRECGVTDLTLVAERLEMTGELSAHEATFTGLLCRDGTHRHHLTRTGARIWDLRHDGWEIATEGGSGRQAVYRLIAKPGERPAAQLPVTSPQEAAGATTSAAVSAGGRWDPNAPLPAPARVWVCECDRELRDPEPLLGDMARGICSVHGRVISRWRRPRAAALV